MSSHRPSEIAGFSMMRIAISVLCLSTLMLASVYSLKIPMRTDGGWYSYPGFALSEGRDPSENLLAPEQLRDHSNGIRAVFGWENRTSLLVLTHAAWFKLAGSGSSSIRAFQILQWLLLTGAIMAAAWGLTRERVATLAVGLLALSDSWIMSESLSDLRPDAPLATVAMVCLGAMIFYCRDFKPGYAVLAGIAAGGTLLMHATGVIPFAGCAAFAGVYCLLAKHRGTRVPWALLGVVALGCLAFLWRLQIFDILIPTQVPTALEEAVRYNFPEKVIGAYSSGIGPKVQMEVARWSDYLFISNALHGLAIFGGLFLTWRSRTGPVGNRGLEAIGVAAAFAAAVSTISILNPHTTSSHLLPVMCIGYVAAAPGIASFFSMSGATNARMLIISMLLGIATLRAAHAVNTYLTETKANVSIDSVKALMRQTVTGEPNQMILAPTIVWPYFPRDSSVVLIDARAHPWAVDSPQWKGISTLIVDREFLDKGWRQVISELSACGAVEDVGSLGRADNGYYLRSLRLVKAGCPSAMALQ